MMRFLMMTMDMLIDPWKVKFEKRYYQKKFGRHLFGWKELETILNIRPLMSAKRVNQYVGTFTWKYSFASPEVNCYPPSILEAIVDKGVCYITDASRFTFKLNAFAKHLEEEYVRPFDAHIYFCRNTSAEHPFGAHFDQQHNVIVQCEGKTNFKVWDRVDNTQELFRTHKHVKMSIDDDPILDVDMSPGDAIWIPKHYPHLATSKTSRLSVSFPQAWEVDHERFEERKWIKL